MRPTSDGGFILCGESTDIWPSEELTDPPYQQGWLLKLDEYGCLVEDCYLSVLENENSENKYFAVGPNPATDYLHIRMCALEGHNCRLRVHDLQGNLCYESPSGMYHNSTLTLSIEQWVKATYVLSMVSENGRVVQSELVVVQ